MQLALWGAAVLLSVWMMNWGADQVAALFSRLRRQWGLTGSAGGVLISLVTASPEVGTSVVAALRGEADIGLGNMLGSNIISVPLVVGVTWLASRSRARGGRGPAAGGTAGDEAAAGPGVRRRPRWRGHLLEIDPRAVGVIAVPYLLIVALVGALTLPAGWRGLQPVDGWIVLAAFLAFFAQAVLRGKRPGEPQRFRGREPLLAAVGAAAVAAGAYLAVRATENIIALVGIPAIVGGLFITGTLGVLPEGIKSWKIGRTGESTSAATSVLADNTVTITLGFFPLALIGTPVTNLLLYAVNLGAVGLLGTLFATSVRYGRGRQGFDAREVLLLIGTYLLYIGAMVPVLGRLG